MLNLLWGAALLFILLWVLGIAVHFTLGGLIHVFLVLAIATIIVRLVAGPRVAA